MHRRPSRTDHRAPLPDGPTTVHAAQASGWTRSAQRHGVRAGDLQRLQRGVIRQDFALHERLIGEAELREAFEACRGRPGRKAARLTLHSADADAESPLESLSRLRIRSAGVPAPSLQAEICDEDGQFLGRCDFYWDEYGVFREADGDLKYERDAGGCKPDTRHEPPRRARAAEEPVAARRSSRGVRAWAPHAGRASGRRGRAPSPA